MNHPLQCKCGKVKGYVAHAERADRVVCYCKDCQAFAHFLGEYGILDEKGGTDIIQALPLDVNFKEGTDALACMRLTPKGLLRWYTSCCNTPIGNIMENFRISYVGLVHNCLDNSGMSLEDSFGPVRAHVYMKSARGEPKPESMGLFAVFFRVMRRLVMARIDGSYKSNPFFVPGSGTPIVTPKVLSQAELETLENSL